MRKNKRDLTGGDIKRQLLRLTVPMIFGILGISIFNLVDTYFVGRLGTDELAALSFTFPIVLTFNSLILGISTGVTAVVSRSVGANEPGRLKNLVLDSMLLATACAVLFIGLGFALLKPVLGLLHAEEHIIPLIMQYMRIWLPGLLFVVFPMTGNGIIRALGDTKTPGLVMLLSGCINAVFDPLFIFGIGPFPAMGISGAALATVIGRFVTFATAIYVLTGREKVLGLKKRPVREVLEHWKDILHIGLPSGLSRVIIPLGTGVITGMMATYGLSAVAGFGVAAKMENLILMISMAMASVLVPYIGQNLGAGKNSRVKKIFDYSNVFTMALQLSLYLLLIFLAPLAARIFSKDPAVIKVAALYIRIVAVAYGFKGIILMSTSMLNAAKKPFIAAFINISQMFVLFIPLAYLGDMLIGMEGIFIALAVSFVPASIIARRTALAKIRDLKR
jgi:putative MATE family efflux protein